MIKNKLKRRKDSDAYLATDGTHRQSPQITMKVDKVCSFQPALRPSSAKEEESNTFKLTHFFTTTSLVNFNGQPFCSMSSILSCYWS